LAAILLLAVSGFASASHSALLRTRRIAPWIRAAPSSTPSSCSRSGCEGGKLYAVYYDGSSRFACGGAFLAARARRLGRRDVPARRARSGRRCSPLPPGDGRSDCPDLAKSEYLTSNSPPPVLSAASVVLNAGAGRAGAACLTRGLPGRQAALLGNRGLHPAHADRLLGSRLATYAQDRARCAWRLPTAVKGVRLVGRIWAEVEGLSVQRAFAVLVR